MVQLFTYFDFWAVYLLDYFRSVLVRPVRCVALTPDRDVWIYLDRNMVPYYSRKSLITHQHLLDIEGVELGMVVACLQHRCLSWLVDDVVLHLCYVLRVINRFNCW